MADESFAAALSARFVKPKPKRRWASPLAMAADLEGASRPVHQRYVDDRLVALEEGEFDKLAISEPPQHGKSFLTTLWYPLWLLDGDPDLRIVVISYNETYASSWGREAKRLIDKHAETLGWDVSPDSKANSLWRVKGRSGGCMYIGVGGGLGGWTVHRVINDDWIKNHEDGFSAEAHERNWTFHQAVVEQRIQHGVKEVCNMTRWSELDLIGRVTEHAPEAWEVVNLPAKAEEGDPLGRPVGQGLWLEKNPQSWYDEKEKSLSAFIWAGLYQQRPAPEGGGILKKKFLRYFHEVTPADTSDNRDRWLLDSGQYIDPDECQRFGIADTASTTRTSSDWTVLGAFAVTPMGDLLLYDVERVRVEEDGLADVLTQFVFRNKVPWIGVEATFTTSDLAYQLGRMGIRFMAIRADQDKLQRALPLRTRLEMRRLHFLAGASWVPTVEKEMMVFTGTGAGGHDDTIDVLAYGSKYLDTTSKGGLGAKRESRAQKKRKTQAQWRAIGAG